MTPKPTGPRTPEGKSRCRLNAHRHGLTGQILVLSPDEQSAFDRHLADQVEHHKPYGPEEQRLVHDIAASLWRLSRATAIENSIFALDPAVDPPETDLDVAFSQAHTWLAEGKSLALLTLYEQRIHRKLQKDLQALQAEQARRIAEYEQAMAVAKLLYRKAQAEGKPYNPEAYFRRPPATPESVYSSTAITAEIARDAIEKSLSPVPIAPERMAA